MYFSASPLQMGFYIIETFRVCLINSKDFLTGECKVQQIGGAIIVMMCKYPKLQANKRTNLKLLEHYMLH